jgi:hypothetical protein
MMGGSIDFDSGGFILSEMERNLQICLEKKKNAVEKYRTRYPEWWLILPDKIGYGLSQSNRRSFRDAFSINHEWDKIILINPIKPKDAFIIESE